jgi:hypothetical protein
MKFSIQAIILRSGNSVRHVAKPETVLRYLTSRPSLAEYTVVYRDGWVFRHVTAAGFIARAMRGELSLAARNSRALNPDRSHNVDFDILKPED